MQRPVHSCSQRSCPVIGRSGQRGAIAAMFPVLLLVMIAICGFSLGLSQVYNRKIELQQVSDAAALAAARQLDGSQAGLDRALAAANSTAANFVYSYHNLPIEWSNSAIQFGSGPDGGSSGWIDGSTARNAAGQIFFVKTDTARLDSKHGVVQNPFLAILSAASAEVEIHSHSIAGRFSMAITPLAVCALSNTPAASRSGELVEYGFRRGVAYDLMQLNPNGTTAENFLLNPIAPAGTVGTAVSSKLGVLQPYVCTGTIALPNLAGGSITVERPFPLASLYQQLNSRFASYTAPCDPKSAPPDANIKAYTYGSDAAWMTNVPAGQTAQSTTSGGKLQTVADPAPSPAGTTGPAYGPLWSYAKAAQYSSYVAGQPEPSTGYASYATSAWPTLYSPGSPTAKASYPTNGPYQATSGTNFQAPPATYKSLRDRRILNVALLQCPVAAGSTAAANVLGVGRFFMTVPATATSLSAEFVGMARNQALGGEVGLFE